MENKKVIDIIDVTPIEVEKSPIQKYRDDFIAGVDVGFNFIERGLDIVSKLAKSTGLGK